MSTTLQKAMTLAKIDLSPDHRPPSAACWVVATVASLAGSLLVDAGLVAIGEAVFPSTKGYGHFQFADYAKLTVVGVIVACLAWPVVVRISSSPRGCSSGWPSRSPWCCGCRTCTSSPGAAAEGGGGADGDAPGHRRGHLQLPGPPGPGPSSPPSSVGGGSVARHPRSRRQADLGRWRRAVKTKRRMDGYQMTGSSRSIPFSMAAATAAGRWRTGPVAVRRSSW